METIDRRKFLILGLGATSTFAAVAHAPAVAATGDEKKLAEGVKVKTLAEGKSMIPGFSKVQLREMTFQPGAVFDMHPMDNAMVCHVKVGALHVDQGAGEFVAKPGTAWTCMAGGKEGAKNKGKTVAVMSISDLMV